MFKNEVIDRYFYCIMQNFKINAHVCIYSLAGLNSGHCVEVTFNEGNLGISPMFTILKTLISLLRFRNERESRINSDENWV